MVRTFLTHSAARLVSLFFLFFFYGSPMWSITNYVISSVMHAFWLVLTYDLQEDRRIDDVIIKTFFFPLYINSLIYKTNRFQVAVRLFSNRSQRTSKCGKNIGDTLDCASVFVLITFWRHLWSITEQTHGNLESIR